jgi:hypothetical protein
MDHSSLWSFSRQLRWKTAARVAHMRHSAAHCSEAASTLVAALYVLEGSCDGICISLALWLPSPALTHLPLDSEQ